MSKKNGGGEFTNRAAKRFKQVDKVDLMSQEEVFEILSGDITTILDQVTKNRNREGQWPNYVPNMFANLSTPLWFLKYCEETVKVKPKYKKNKKGKKTKKVLKYKIKTDLTEEQVESLKQILADAFKKSATNQYSNQTQEFEERNELITKAFIHLEPRIYHLTGKLTGLSKAQRRELAVQVWGDPVNNMKFVHRLFNISVVSDKKKLKIMKAMYEDRFVTAVGAALTVDTNNSDCIAMLYDYLMSKKSKKKRAPYILAYAEAYKKNKESNFRLKAEGEFYEKNKRLFKELAGYDIGYKKSFKRLKPKKNKDAKKDKVKDKKRDKES